MQDDAFTNVLFRFGIAPAAPRIGEAEGNLPDEKPTIEPVMSPDCVAEWQQARVRCAQLFAQGLLGAPSSRFGMNVQQCIRGQVSQRCGGNRIN